MFVLVVVGALDATSVAEGLGPFCALAHAVSMGVSVSPRWFLSHMCGLRVVSFESDVKVTCIIVSFESDVKVTCSALWIGFEDVKVLSS